MRILLSISVVISIFVSACQSNILPQNTIDTIDIEDTSSREIRIIIPPGTDELLRDGKDPGLVSDYILLKLGEQDILVIENQDTSSHVIGPFFINAGESIRQVFTAPGIYEGTCSIHENAQIRIIVEE